MAEDLSREDIAYQTGIIEGGRREREEAPPCPVCLPCGDCQNTAAQPPVTPPEEARLTDEEIRIALEPFLSMDGGADYLQGRKAADAATAKAAAHYAVMEIAYGALQREVDYKIDELAAKDAENEEFLKNINDGWEFRLKTELAAKEQRQAGLVALVQEVHGFLVAGVTNDGEGLLERIEAALPPDVGAEAALCDKCGPDIKIDEDGCCTTCGKDSIPVSAEYSDWVRQQASQRQEAE